MKKVFVWLCLLPNFLFSQQIIGTWEDVKSGEIFVYAPDHSYQFKHIINNEVVHEGGYWLTYYPPKSRSKLCCIGHYFGHEIPLKDNSSIILENWLAVISLKSDTLVLEKTILEIDKKKRMEVRTLVRVKDNEYEKQLDAFDYPADIDSIKQLTLINSQKPDRKVVYKSVIYSALKGYEFVVANKERSIIYHEDVNSVALLSEQQTLPKRLLFSHVYGDTAYFYVPEVSETRLLREAIRINPIEYTPSKLDAIYTKRYLRGRLVKAYLPAYTQINEYLLTPKSGEKGKKYWNYAFLPLRYSKNSFFVD